MKVILRQDHDKLGEAGKIIQVKPGYARNFLIPKGIVYPATSENVKKYDRDKEQLNMKIIQEQRKSEELAKVLENVSCTITVQVGEEDKLFGSLETQGHKIDKRKIVLDEPIKSLGIYSVPIKLHPEVEAKVKVWVVKE